MGNKFFKTSQTITSKHSFSPPPTFTSLCRLIYPRVITSLLLSGFPLPLFQQMDLWANDKYLLLAIILFLKQQCFGLEWYQREEERDRVDGAGISFAGTNRSWRCSRWRAEGEGKMGKAWLEVPCPEMGTVESITILFCFVLFQGMRDQQLTLKHKFSLISLNPL